MKHTQSKFLAPEFSEAVELLLLLRLESPHVRRPPCNLTTAVMRGSVELVRAFLDAGYDPNEETIGCVSPLYQAVDVEDLEKVDLLLSRGASPDGESEGFAPLCRAAENGNVAIIKALIAAGADVLSVGERAVRVAMANEKKGAVRFLTQSIAAAMGKSFPQSAAGEDADAAKPENAPLDAWIKQAERLAASADRTILRGKERERAIQRLVTLIDAGNLDAPINERGANGDTLLSMAAENGDMQVITKLVEHGANVNGCGRHGVAPLLFAARAGHTGAVSFLLQHGAEIEPLVDGSSPLFPAAEWGDLKMVEMLLAAGCRADVEDNERQRPSAYASGVEFKAIRDALRRASLVQAGNKSRRGEGVFFIKQRRAIDIGKATGAKDFRKMNATGSWACILAQGSAEDVARAFAEMVNSSRWEADTAKRRILSAREYVFVVKLTGSGWVSIIATRGASGNLPDWAAELSRRLRTKTVHYASESKSGVEGYDLFVEGERVEAGWLMDELQFQSEIRSAPPRLRVGFPDAIFELERIYIPPCWIQDNSEEVKMGFDGLKPKDIERLDFVVIQEN